VHFNGGFGRADRLSPEDVLVAPRDAATLVAAEQELLDALNASGGALAARLARGADPGRRAWRAIGLDPEGVDLSAGAATARIVFTAPAFNPESWRRRVDEILAA